MLWCFDALVPLGLTDLMDGCMDVLMNNCGCVEDAWMLGPFWSHRTQWMRKYGWMRNGWSGWVASSLFVKENSWMRNCVHIASMLRCLVPFGLSRPSGWIVVDVCRMLCPFGLNRPSGWLIVDVCKMLGCSAPFGPTEPSGWETEDECGTGGAGGRAYICGSPFCMQKCTCSPAS